MASRKTTASKGKPAAAKATAARKAAPARKTAAAKVGTKTTKAPARAKAAPARKKAAVAPPAPKPKEQELGGPAYEAARIAAEAALDKKAEDVVILDVRGLTSYADFFVVASGGSDRQVSAIADGVEEKMKKAGHRPIGVEGYTRGHWVLLDFGDVVAHVFYEEARGFYDIEGLWADAKRIPVG